MCCVCVCVCVHVCMCVSTPSALHEDRNRWKPLIDMLFEVGGAGVLPMENMFVLEKER